MVRRMRQEMWMERKEKKKKRDGDLKREKIRGWVQNTECCIACPIETCATKKRVFVHWHKTDLQTTARIALVQILGLLSSKKINVMGKGVGASKVNCLLLNRI